MSLRDYYLDVRFALSCHVREGGFGFGKAGLLVIEEKRH
jgi:hypothetical protein